MSPFDFHWFCRLQVLKICRSLWLKTPLSAFEDWKWNVVQRSLFYFSFLSLKGYKNCEKRRKCWLSSFSHFPTMFTKANYPRVASIARLFVKRLRVEWVQQARFSTLFLMKRKCSCTCYVELFFWFSISYKQICLYLFVTKLSKFCASDSQYTNANGWQMEFIFIWL